MPLEVVAGLILGTGAAAFASALISAMHERRLDEAVREAALNKHLTLEKVKIAVAERGKKTAPYNNQVYSKHLLDESSRREAELVEKAKKIADAAAAHQREFEIRQRELENELKASKISIQNLEVKLNSSKDSASKEFKPSCRRASLDPTSDDGSTGSLSPSTARRDIFHLFSSPRKMSPDKDNSPLLKSKYDSDLESNSSAPSSPKGSFSFFGRRKSSDSESEICPGSPKHARRSSLDGTKEIKLKYPPLNHNLESILESPTSRSSSPITIEHERKKSGSAIVLKDKHKESTSLSPESEKKGGSLLALFKSSETSKGKKDLDSSEGSTQKTFAIDLGDFSPDSGQATPPMSPKTARKSKEKFSFFTKKSHSRSSSVDKDKDAGSPIALLLEVKNDKSAKDSHDKETKPAMPSLVVIEQKSLKNSLAITREQVKPDNSQEKYPISPELFTKLEDYAMDSLLAENSLLVEEPDTPPSSIESASVFLGAPPPPPSSLVLTIIDVNLGGLDLVT